METYPGADAHKGEKMSTGKARRWIPAAGVAVVLLGAQLAVQATGQATEVALPGAVVRSTSSEFDPTSPKTVAARCPAGQRVIGGGGRVNNASHVVITALQPVHTNNLDRYEVSAAEDEIGFSGQWAVQAFAICADPLPGLRIVSATSESGSADSKLEIVNCPTQTLTLGSGGRIGGGHGQVHLNNTSAGSDRGFARGQEDSTGFAGNWTVTAYAVCADVPVSGHAVITGFSPQGGSIDRKFAEATCPNGMRVTGGSAAISGGDTIRAVIESINPDVLPGGSPGSRIQVIARENTPTNSNWTVQAIASCTR